MPRPDRSQLTIDFEAPPEPKAVRRRLRKNVPVRPTEAELAELHRRKASFGYKSLSKYLIERGLNPGQAITLLDEAKVGRLLYEVRRLGVNLNQIAQRLNQGRRLSSPQELERAIKLTSEILAEIGGAINR